MADIHEVISFPDVTKEDVRVVGARGLQIALLKQAGFPLADGFIIPTTAGTRFFKAHSLSTKIAHLMKTINFADPVSILQVTTHIQTLIRQAPVSNELIRAIASQYKTLGLSLKDVPVTLSPSPHYSDDFEAFADVKRLRTPVRGETAIVLRVKDIWAAQFTATAVFYREKHGIDHFRLGPAIVIERTTQEDFSGTLSTIHAETHDQATIYINAVYGSAAILSDATVTPDRYEVSREHTAITRKYIAEQKTELAWVKEELHHVEIPKKKQKLQKISDETIVQLAEIGEQLERHLSHPQLITWVVSGGNITITSVEPTPMRVTETQLQLPLVTGTANRNTIVSGQVRVVTTNRDLMNLSHEDILVAKKLSKELVQAAKKTAALITEEVPKHEATGTLTHLVSVPYLSGAKGATKTLSNKTLITLNGKKGEVTNGGHLTPVPHTVRHRLHHTEFPATKLYFSLENGDVPDISGTGISGVGLLDGGKIIQHIGTHPKKLLREGKGRDFTRQLAGVIATVAQAVSPRPVHYVLSNLTSTEYASLTGGKAFEPTEANPFIGFRGAIRAIHDPEVLSLELAAITLVRQDLGLQHVSIVIPYVHSPQEYFTVKKMLHAHGLSRSASLKHWLLLQIPGNVIQFEEFLKVGIDGVILDSDTLSVLFSGIDLKNPEVSHSIDHENEALLQAIKHCITIGNRENTPVLFSGTMPSPAMLRLLTTWGITGITLPPHALENVRKTIYKYESMLVG